MESNLELRREIIELFRRHCESMKDRLIVQKHEAEEFAADPDWPWSGLVLSFATLGGSANWDSRIKKRRGEFSWASVSSLNNAARGALFHELPNARFRTKVERYIESAFQRIRAKGGPAAVRAEYNALSSSEQRIAYFMLFDGIGEKYGRNIPMDIYDPLVRSSFALDHRLKSILAQLTGKSSMSYRQGEDFLQAVAHDLEIDGWTFDRVLYARYKQIMSDLEALRAGATPPP